MKRFAALALVGSFPLVATAGPPVSVHPASPTQPSSLNQPLSAAVQSAAAALPPATTMASTPSWGTPAVYPGTLVNNSGPAAVPCADPADAQPVRPYFNLLAPRGNGCDPARGTCLDKLKDWFCYRSTAGGFPCTPTPSRAPLRAYFRCTVPGCGTGACATGGCATGHPAPAKGVSVNTLNVPVNRLSDGCDTPAVSRPRVRYVPLTARAEVPAVGCDARPSRPRLLERVMGFFTPKWGAMCGDATAPACETPPAAPGWSTTLPPTPAVAPAPTVTPAPMPMPTATPAYTPVKPNGKPIQFSPLQPFTSP